MTGPMFSIRASKSTSKRTSTGNPFKCKQCGHSKDVPPGSYGNCKVVSLITGETCGCPHG